MKHYLLLFLLLFPLRVLAEDNVITLVVSSDGPSKQAAINNALRNAIEQSYGSFISSNTLILNDEVIKDEIISLSYGNILGYKELGCFVAQDLHYVTLEVTVSLTKLCSYAKSKGASAELNGALFVQNLKLYRLNQENEKKALANLGITILTCKEPLCVYSLTVGEPTLSKDERTKGKVLLSGVMSIRMTEQGQALLDYIRHTLEGVAMSKAEIDYASQTGLETGWLTYGTSSDKIAYGGSWSDMEKKQDGHKFISGDLFNGGPSVLFASGCRGGLDFRNDYMNEFFNITFHDTQRSRRISYFDFFHEGLTRKVLNVEFWVHDSEGNTYNLRAYTTARPWKKGSLDVECDVKFEPLTLKQMEKLKTIEVRDSAPRLMWDSW